MYRVNYVSNRIHRSVIVSQLESKFIASTVSFSRFFHPSLLPRFSPSFSLPLFLSHPWPIPFPLLTSYFISSAFARYSIWARSRFPYESRCRAFDVCLSRRPFVAITSGSSSRVRRFVRVSHWNSVHRIGNQYYMRRRLAGDARLRRYSAKSFSRTQKRRFAYCGDIQFFTKNCRPRIQNEWRAICRSQSLHRITV